MSGVSGPIGAALLPSLKSRGYEVTRLVRGTSSTSGQIPWGPAYSLPPESVSGFGAVIHLAGESIAGRWTEARKQRILESRRLGTSHLAEALAQTSQPPRVLISGSAIGYYGNRGDDILREESASGDGYLSEVCRQWEGATQPATRAGIRTVQIRLGVVLSATGGALKTMLLPFRLGLGGNVGDGRQWWSWVHVHDVVGSIHHILQSDLLEGPVNVVSPRPVTNVEFTKILASVLSRPAILPMPAFAARLVLGEMADELLLASQRVEPAKLVSSGYPFQFSDLKKALEEILKR